ncbi:hypothetical protein [Halobacillus sp. A5]|uniref:hypothetical protein n=1 Tax=Halobacillus sp. A5 TaxID=2880263 RepID=UPI0020A61E73|nr:hypothetical protein [Halobacillus sp. A5]MCP3025396.1 hypothetical protein [Halobacillus sp. A5]
MIKKVYYSVTVFLIVVAIASFAPNQSKADQCVDTVTNTCSLENAEICQQQ